MPSLVSGTYPPLRGALACTRPPVAALVEAHADARAALRAADDAAFAAGSWPEAGTDRGDEANPLPPAIPIRERHR